MLGRLIKVVVFLLIIGSVVYKFFFYVDFDNGCFIKIKPAIFELSASNIKQAIKVLKYAVPAEYENFCNQVDLISPNISCGGFQGGCFYPDSNSREIYLSTANQDFLGWTAAVIAHETCHAIQFQAGGYEGLDEGPRYAIGNAVMQSVIEF